MTRRLRVLFVCALNKRRSVTAERMYREDPRVEVRSAGVRSESPRRVSERDLCWADVVFAMEREQRQRIAERFVALQLPPIDVLDIPDDYECMDPELVGMLRAMLDPEIDARRRALGEDDRSEG
ncbi:MAG: protein-tyrosine-phosphatase [Opitutaceae bacterium]|nr:protein-tyrosine-phosphatase [Opitutaceae bacterium]